MVKQFEPIDDGYAIIIDRPTLELMGIDPDTPFELTAERGGLFLSPISADCEHKAKIERSTVRMAIIHRQSLEKLAQ
jgi:hypothetical protein